MMRSCCLHSIASTGGPVTLALDLRGTVSLDELYLSLQELVGEPNIMNRESMPLRMRAFRVIDFQGGEYYRCLVIEDVGRAQFRIGSCSFGGGRTEEMQARMDRIYEAMQTEINRADVLNVLHLLRNASCFREAAWSDLAADSIDAAVSQYKMRFRKLMERFLPEKIPISVPSEPEPTGKGSTPVLIMPIGSPSEEGSEESKAVWDYAGGKRMDWKPIGSTPAGRSCEVLTFDGSEEVLVGATSLEIPAQ